MKLPPETPTSFPFSARYRSVCAECDDWYYSGDTVVMTKFGAVHLSCYENPSEPPDQVCVTCWLVHPEGECDR